MPPVSPTPPPHALQTPAQALWRLREYLRPYYARLFFIVLAAVTAVTAETLIPIITKSVIDRVVVAGIRSELVPLAILAMALGVLQAGMNFFRRWSVSGATVGMEMTIRNDLYHHLQRLEPAFHDSWQSGQLLSRATTDLSTIRRFAGFGVVFFITNTWTFVLIVALLIDMNWWLGLLTGLVFLPVALLCMRFEKRYRVLSRRYQDQQGDLATYVEEAASGIRVLKALGRRDQAAARHVAQARVVYRTQVDKARLRGTFWAALDLVPNAAIGLLLLLGIVAVGRHELSLGGLVAFVTLMLLLVWPIEAMGVILATGQEAATAAQRIYEIFDTVPLISDPAAPPGASMRRPGLSAGRWNTRAPAVIAPQHGPAASPGSGRLVFERVIFGYPEAPALVLRGVSLELEPGETVALVGATGSGKTTLLQLVPRLADVTGGRITLDGLDVRDLPLPELRSRVGCAFEDPTLFSASVRENVGFGVPDASEASILAALDAAQAEFVADLPWGLDTRIGEQGMALSGGQRQRVALARAILARPEVLVLDDPLSALDVHTEAKVTAALASVLTSSTALIVAHRPSTVLLADRVALLDGGVIAAVGTHHELLATQPRYRELMSADDPDGAADGGLGSDGRAAPGLTAGASR
jgi:ATP-binding cassette, subfamily B, bacterial